MEARVRPIQASLKDSRTLAVQVVAVVTVGATLNGGITAGTIPGGSREAIRHFVLLKCGYLGFYRVLRSQHGDLVATLHLSSSLPCPVAHAPRPCRSHHASTTPYPGAVLASALWRLSTTAVLYGLPVAMGTYYGMVRYAASMLVVTTRAGSGTGGVLRVRSLGALVDEQQQHQQHQQQQQQQVGGFCMLYGCRTRSMAYKQAGQGGHCGMADIAAPTGTSGQACMSSNQNAAGVQLLPMDGTVNSGCCGLLHRRRPTVTSLCDRFTHARAKPRRR